MWKVVPGCPHCYQRVYSSSKGDFEWMKLQYVRLQGVAALWEFEYEIWTHRIADPRWKPSWLRGWFGYERDGIPGLEVSVCGNIHESAPEYSGRVNDISVRLYLLTALNGCR